MAAQTAFPTSAIPLHEAGDGRPALVLHGGGGPATVAPIAAHLAGAMHVLTPTHPGWDGTPLPASIGSIRQLAGVYLRLLRERDLHDVLLVGSSIGGWLAAEIALADVDGRIAGLVLVDAAGIDVPGEPIADVFALSPQELAQRSWHAPDRFFVDPAQLPPERRTAIRANLEALRTLTADPYMHDPSLRERLGAIAVPTLVLWGESDRVATPDYGRAYAAAIPAARFAAIAGAGHLPQLEQPAATAALIDAHRMRTSGSVGAGGAR
jgi:pimeloyl-ACP methyl ester carboxylesterase